MLVRSPSWEQRPLASAGVPNIFSPRSTWRRHFLDQRVCGHAPAVVGISGGEPVQAKDQKAPERACLSSGLTRCRRVADREQHRAEQVAHRRQRRDQAGVALYGVWRRRPCSLQPVPSSAIPGVTNSQPPAAKSAGLAATAKSRTKPIARARSGLRSAYDSTSPHATGRGGTGSGGKLGCRLRSAQT